MQKFPLIQTVYKMLYVYTIPSSLPIFILLIRRVSILLYSYLWLSVWPVDNISSHMSMCLDVGPLMARMQRVNATKCGSLKQCLSLCNFDVLCLVDQ
jgi:hypothetical protein